MSETFLQDSSYKKAFSLDWVASHFLGERYQNLSLRRSRLEQLREENLRKLKAQGHIGRPIPMDIREGLTKEEFVSQYLRANRPVVLKGVAKDWNCVKTWTPDRLKEKYGEDRIPLIDASPKIDDITQMDYSVKYVDFKDVIEGMKVGDNSMYSRFNDLLGNHPELRDDFDIDWFVERREKLVSGKVFQCFIGGKGTYTHIHSAIQSNFFTQVYGQKRWLLYPPSYNQYLRPIVEGRPYFGTLYRPTDRNFSDYPEMEYLDYYDVTLEPGDILYNPPSWWHHVMNDTMTIGVGFRWTSVSATLKASPIQLLLTLFAYNPSILFAIKSRGDFAKVFGYKKKQA